MQTNFDIFHIDNRNIFWYNTVKPTTLCTKREASCATFHLILRRMKTMKKTRIGIAALLISAMAMSMTACGKESSVYSNPMDSANKDAISEALGADSQLSDGLENKTIKWMATWDINPDGTGKKTPTELEVFQQKYGGIVEYHPVEWETRFDQLANAINSGEGIDFYPASDLDVFPKGAIKDMFVPIDDYIDFTDPLFAPIKEAADLFQWKGKHYVIVNDITGDNCVCIYNRDTFEENGLEDPAKLFAEGKWDWNKFQEQLQQFVDPENEQFGIDGWWYEAGLSGTCSVPYIGMKDGKLVNNMKDPAIERLQNWMYELGTTNCVAIGVGDFGWNAMPNYIGEGKELFHPCGAWALFDKKQSWAAKFGENAMFVPMPKDPESSEYYIPCGIDGYVMVKGGKNPEGVAKFAACKRFAITDEVTSTVGTEQLASDYGWTDEMVEMLHKCHELAKANPHYDFMNSVSSEISTILDSNDAGGIRAASKGQYKWSESVSAAYSAINSFIDQANNS